MFLVKCPKCGHEQKTQPMNNNDFSKKRKVCVYCGKGFGVKDHIVKVIK